MSWTPEEERAAHLIHRVLGPATVLAVTEHPYSERVSVSDIQNDGDIEWPVGAQGTPAQAAIADTAPTGAVAYPEYPDNPHNHRFTLSVTGGGAPMMVVRGNTASEVQAGINELEAYGVWASIGAAHGAMAAQGKNRQAAPASPAPTAYGPPAQAPQFPTSGPPFGPNVSVPGAPDYVGPPQQQWNQPAPAQQNWGGGAASGAASGKAEPKPQPPGWYKVNARTGPGFDNWKAMREQHKDNLKGKINWGGNSDYWVDPGIAQWIAQQGWAVSQ